MLDTSNHILTRRTCSAYAGSFIARAAYLSPNLVEECLNVMARCCHNYLTSHEGTLCCIHTACFVFTSKFLFSPLSLLGKPPDAEVHALFYSVCQSIFYIYCFKHPQLLDSDRGREHFKQLHLERIIESSLNPFKVRHPHFPPTPLTTFTFLQFCLNTVISEFVRITESLHLLSCQHIIGRNKKLTLPTKSIFGGANQMETFFPFDPYLLRHSSRYLQGIYQSWAQPDRSSELGKQLSETLPPSFSSPISNL